MTSKRSGNDITPFILLILLPFFTGLVCVVSLAGNRELPAAEWRPADAVLAAGHRETEHHRQAAGLDAKRDREPGSCQSGGLGRHR